MAANESIPGSSRMILGGQLGSFHSQLFYPAGPLMSPDRTLASGSMTALHSGIGVQQARDITADFQSGGLHWFTPQDEVRMQYMRNLLDNNERRGYFQICGTQSHPPNSVQVSPTDARDVEGGLLMAKEPWSRTVDNPNNGLRGEQFNVPQMMHDRMMHMAMMPNPTVVSEGMIKAHQERHTNLRYGEANEPAKRPLSDADAAQTETTASAGGPSAAPADFMADQAAQRNETMARVRDAEVAAQAPLDVSSEAVRRFHAEHLDPSDTELMERLLRPSRMFRSGTPGNYQMPPFTALGEQARARELVGGGKGMVGGAWWDALDPNQNGVAAAFNSAGAAIKNEFENPQSKLRNEFENPQSKLRGEILPAVGNEFTNSKSVLRKDILPIASRGLNAAAQIVPQLGPLAGVVGVAQAANEAGAWWDEHVAPTATGVAINNELTNPKSTLRSEVIPALTSTTPVSVLLMNQLTDPRSTLRSKTIPASMDPKSDLRTKHLPVGAAALNVVAGTLPELGPVAKVLNTAQDVSETAAMFGFGKSGGAHHAYPPSLLKLLHEKAEKAARKERKRKRHAEKEKDFPSGLA